MEKSFVVQLFKNPLWAQLRDGRCRERDSEVLWEHWSFGLGFWRLIPSPVHPSWSWGEGGQGVPAPHSLLDPPDPLPQPWRCSSSAFLRRKTKGTWNQSSRRADFLLHLSPLK